MDTSQRVWLCCGFSLAILLAAICAFAEEGSPPQVAAARVGYPNSWAVVIGINAYQKAHRLNYAVADARAVAALLPSLGFPEKNIFTLLDGEATKPMIEAVLYKSLSGMGLHDRLFFYFAGHGETMALRNGEEGYLLPVDADPDSLPLTAIAMDELRRVSQRLRAKHYLFVIDACFSGFAVTRDASPSKVSDEYLVSALQEPVVQVITAGRKGEESIEERGHGLFTRRLIDGLGGLADTEGRGIISASQLASWIEQRVVRDSRGKMNPQYGKLDGEGQFLFFRAGSVRSQAGPSADLSGTFTGMITGTAGGRDYTIPVTLTVVQRGNDLSGTWTGVTGSSGTIAGIVDGSGIRAFRVNQANPCPAVYSGSALAEDNNRRLRGSYAGNDCNGKLWVSASFVLGKVTREETLDVESQQPRDLIDIGMSYLTQSRPVDAMDYLERGMRLAEARGNRPDQIRALALIGLLHRGQGHDVEAISALEQSLQLARRLDDESNMSVVFYFIGLVHLDKGRDAEALSHFEDSLRLAEKLGDEAQQARVLQSLGSLDLRESRYSQALSRLQRATEIADRLGLAEKNQIHKMRDDALTKAR